MYRAVRAAARLPAWGMLGGGVALPLWVGCRLLRSAARGVEAAHRAGGSTGLSAAIEAVATAVLAAACAWLALAVASTVMAESGRWGERIAGRVAAAATPRVVRAAVRAACGLTLAGPLLAHGAAASAQTGDGLLPPPDRPSSAAHVPGHAVHDGGARDAVSAGWQRAAAPRRSTHRAAATEITVRPGDTLWSIAAARLPADASAADVARAWPVWFRQNAGVIGPNPDLILIGTSLTVPAQFHLPSRRPKES